MKPALMVPCFGSLDSSARAVINAMTTPPSPTRKRQINALVVALKAGGVWSRLDSLYILAAADAQAASVDWRRAAALATVTNAPTFAADRGYTFNGSTQYLDTAFTPSTQGVNMVGSLGTWAVWERTNLAETSYHGARGTAGAPAATLLAPRKVGDTIAGSIAAPFVDCGTGQTSSIGLTAVSQNNSTTASTHKNGVSKGSGTTASSGGTANRSLWIGGWNAGSLSGPRAVQVAACFAGSLQTDALHLSAYNALQAYMTAVGA